MRALTGLGARCGKIKTYHIAPLIIFFIPSLSAFMINSGQVASRSIAQLVEFWSPKPAVGGSIPSAPAIMLFCSLKGWKTLKNVRAKEVFFFYRRS